MDRLLDLSDQLAAAVQRAGQSIVAVHGRPRVPSTGIHWRPGLIVTANHTLQADEDLTVTSPTGALTSVAHGVLLVVKAEGYDLRIVQQAKEQLTKSGAKLLDFGLAKLAPEPRRMKEAAGASALPTAMAAEELPDQSGRGHGHGSLHVPRAGASGRAGRSHGFVLLWSGAVRNGDGPAAFYG